MVNVTGAYSAIEDLLTGDIPRLPQHGDGSGMIKAAADDIDAQIGHIYITPVVVTDDPKFRPTRLLLKKINNLIASGRMMLDMAAAGEDDTPDAYGLMMLREGQNLLMQITEGKIDLAGAPRINGDPVGPAAASVHNEDSGSMVQAFYDAGSYGRYYRQPILPYDNASN